MLIVYYLCNNLKININNLLTDEFLYFSNDLVNDH